MSFNPHFGGYYEDEWPYPPKAGVGLELQGKPSDQAQFLEILQLFNCNLIGAVRIFDTLEKKEIKQVTVNPYLDFDDIGDALKLLGVTMTIIPPFKYETENHIENNIRLDHIAEKMINHSPNGAYRENESITALLTTEQQKEVENRVKMTKDSFRSHQKALK